MNARTFVDTNVLTYAHDADAGRKREIAKHVLQELWIERSGILSMQVLQEFYVNVTRKIRTPLASSAARSVVNAYAPWCVESATATDMTSAFQIEDDARIGFWDALIVAVAARSGATRLLSEDLNPGQKIAGIVVENPFAAVADRPRRPT
jgi:predicted nucleic acid-binding protein